MPSWSDRFFRYKHGHSDLRPLDWLSELVLLLYCVGLLILRCFESVDPLGLDRNGNNNRRSGGYRPESANYLVYLCFWTSLVPRSFPFVWIFNFALSSDGTIQKGQKCRMLSMCTVLIMVMFTTKQPEWRAICILVSTSKTDSILENGSSVT